MRTSLGTPARYALLFAASMGATLALLLRGQPSHEPAVVADATASTSPPANGTATVEDRAIAVDPGVVEDRAPIDAAGPAQDALDAADPDVVLEALQGIHRLDGDASLDSLTRLAAAHASRRVRFAAVDVMRELAASDASRSDELHAALLGLDPASETQTLEYARDAAAQIEIADR